jgi:hypothetical protein
MQGIATAPPMGRSPEEAADLALGIGPTRILLSSADDETRGRVRASVAAAFEPYVEDGAVRPKASAWIVTARKP